MLATKTDIKKEASKRRPPIQRTPLAASRHTVSVVAVRTHIRRLSRSLTRLAVGFGHESRPTRDARLCASARDSPLMASPEARGFGQTCHVVGSPVFLFGNSALSITLLSMTHVTPKLDFCKGTPCALRPAVRATDANIALTKAARFRNLALPHFMTRFRNYRRMPGAAGGLAPVRSSGFRRAGRGRPGIRRSRSPSRCPAARGRSGSRRARR